MFKYLIIFLLSVSFYSHAESQGIYCQGDQYTYDYVKIFVVDGCSLEVVVCYRCLPTGPDLSFWIHGWTALPPCSSSLTPSEIFDELSSQIKTESFIQELYDACNKVMTIPPCDESERLQLNYYEYICWMKENVAGQIYYVNCDYEDVYCYALYDYCVDSNNKLQFTIVSGPSVSGNPANCPSLVIPSDPTPGNTSSCFRLPTLCFP
jgi:hypothetical protein